MTIAQQTTQVTPPISTKSQIFTGSVFRNTQFHIPSFEKVWLPTISGYVQILVNDISYFRAENMMTRLHKSDGDSFCVNESLKMIEQILAPKGFVRTHKSFMVNVYNISKYVKKENGYVTMICNAQVPISRRNKWKLRLDD